jgi:hypothetical protein
MVSSKEALLHFMNIPLLSRWRKSAPQPSDKKINELLEKISTSSKINKSHGEGLNATLGSTAELLVELDKRSAFNAARNLKLSESVNGLTWAILFLTVILLALGACQTYYTKLSYKLSEKQKNAATQSQLERKSEPPNVVVTEQGNTKRKSEPDAQPKNR